MGFPRELWQLLHKAGDIVPERLCWCKSSQVKSGLKNEVDIILPRDIVVRTAASNEDNGVSIWNAARATTMVFQREVSSTWERKKMQDQLGKT